MHKIISLLLRVGLSLGLALPLLAPVAVRAGEIKTSNDPCGKISIQAKKMQGAPTVNLRLRDGACLNGTKVMKVLPAGTPIQILGAANGWYKVSYEGMTGWMSSEYVNASDVVAEKDKKPAATVTKDAVLGKRPVVGITEADFLKVEAKRLELVNRLKDKVLLRVQKKGETWYVEKDGSLSRVKMIGKDEFKRWTEEVKKEKAETQEIKKETKPEKKEATYQLMTNELILKASALPGAVQLAWSLRSSEGLQGYKVVRSHTNEDPSYPNDGALEFIPGRDTLSFIDGTAVPGKTYFYRICSLEKDGSVACGNVLKVVAKQR